MQQGRTWPLIGPLVDTLIRLRLCSHSCLPVRPQSSRAETASHTPPPLQGSLQGSQNLGLSRDPIRLGFSSHSLPPPPCASLRQAPLQITLHTLHTLDAEYVLFEWLRCSHEHPENRMGCVWASPTKHFLLGCCLNIARTIYFQHPQNSFCLDAACVATVLIKHYRDPQCEFCCINVRINVRTTMYRLLFLIYCRYYCHLAAQYLEHCVLCAPMLSCVHHQRMP